MNPNKILHNTIHSQFNYHTLPVTPFNAKNKTHLIVMFKNLSIKRFLLKGVFAKNERGYRLNAIKKRF